jgi:DNA-binding XRE family transcriptional regulator
MIELLTSTHSTNVGQMPRLTRLRELRQRAALSQADLADKAHVARTTIIRLEQGDPNVQPSTLRKLTRALRLKRPTELWEEPDA